MGLTSLQVCMDSSDWLQGTLQEDESGMDSSPSPLSPNDMLACSRPLNMERRLRPPHDQALKCPRCESTHTKFCYYNNYSLSQPRYFCKTCRRYWTKGGTLRNIPVGGGCRKTKKTPSKAKQNDNASPVSAAGQSHAVGGSSSSNTTDLQLSFPDQVQFAHLSGLIGPHHHQHHHHHNNFLPIDFMESKLEGIVGNNSHRNGNDFDFMGNSASGGGDLGMVNLGNGTTNHGLLMEHNFHANICAPFGMSLLEGGQCGPAANSNGVFIDTCQRMMLPYEASGSGGGGGGGGHEGRGGIDVKPNTKALLSLDWQQEQGCSSDHHVGKDSFGYLNGLGNWSGVMNNYGPSTTNSLV